MKTLICIVFLFGTTICTTDPLQSTNDNHNNNADKDPNSISYQSQSDIHVTSSNNVPTTVSNVISKTLSNDSTSPTVNKQEDQRRGLSDAETDSKNTVPPREKSTKSSADDSKIQEQETREDNNSKQPPPSIDHQTEETDPKTEQEPDVVQVTELPKSDENDNREVTTQSENVTLTSGEKEQPEEKVVPEEKTPPCSLLWPECLRDNWNHSVSDVVKGLMTFTMDLYHKVSDLNPSPNLVVSPISVALALSQLLLGTDGDTKKDMLGVLFKGVKDTHCIHDVIQNLTTQDSFISTSEIFYNKELQIHKEFLDQSSRFYGSKGIPLPKDKAQSLEKINSWVSQRTKNLIPSILQELPPDLQLVLVNAIYYQGKWLSQFDPKLTRNENFNRLSLGSVKVPTMHAHKYPLQLTRDKYLQAQVARFPLSNNCSLLIFLPTGNAEDSLETMRKRLNQAILNLVITQLEEVPARPTSVSIPQLKLDTSMGLNDALRLLGLYELFEYPNLCALSNSTGLAVSDVNHRTLLEIKEEGARAAAATTITIARTITVFTVKRPFLFILVSDDTRVPLFIGHVSDPSQ